MRPNAALSTRISIADLRTEFVSLPLGVTELRPLLSWRIEADRRGVQQVAYRIEAARSAEALAADQPDLWDSGRVASDGCFGIRYDGVALTARARCYWRVRIWDERGAPSAPSAAAWWEMGLLESSDWQAQWLAVEHERMRDDRASGLRWIKGPVSAEASTVNFRLSFSTAAAAQATLFVAGYGEIDVWVDAEKVPSPPLASFIVGPRPASEISLPIVAGRHVLAVSLGMPDSRLASFGFPAGELAPFLSLRSSDGSTLRLNWAGWKAAQSDSPNWQRIDFDDSRWENATVVEAPRHQPWPPQPAFHMRRAFKAPKAVTRARIYATALGGYELHLNGNRVGDALLSPESTDFRKRALYSVYDVTQAIRIGENVLGALVGDGWYASYTVIAGRYAWGPPPRLFLAQLELSYEDGSFEVIASGPDWQISPSPIVSSEIYNGECYDARLEQRGWAAPGFDSSSWEATRVAPTPTLDLCSQIAPPIRREMTLRASAITQPRAGVFVFDFGQNFAGWCRLNVTGTAGTLVEVRFAEILRDNGEIDSSNLRAARQTDTYILRGDPNGESFEPHFTYHGFRYVQVTGFPGVPTQENLQGVVIHSDLKITGELVTDNKIINGLVHNTHWSQRSNFMGIPTDCPQRDERMGWMGDANVFWDAASFNMDVAAFTRRFMNDARDAQAHNGAYSEFAPAAYRDPDNAGVNAATARSNTESRGAAPGWADAGVVLPWTVWQRYGDTGIIHENWHAMKRYLAFVATANCDYVWRNSRGADYGDWLALDAKEPGDPTTPKDLIATAMWAHSVACMAQMALAVGQGEDRQRYIAVHKSIVAAFEKEFVQSDGTVGNGSQTGYILALRYHLLPESLRLAAGARLVANIKERGVLLTTGFLGTPNSLDTLADAGYVDIAYDLLLRTEFPSWGYMVAKGATTIWERWNGDTGDIAMNSFNHYALGAVTGFLYRRLAGIAALEPGFRKIQVRPLLDPRITRAKGGLDSVLGKIETSWCQHRNGLFTLDLIVPPNAVAEVHIPAKRGTMPTENGKRLDDNSDIRSLQRSEDTVVVEVGSGVYRFESRPAATGDAGPPKRSH